MSNLNKSSELINKLINRLIKGADKVIAKLYANTLNEIRKELTKIYEKYEVDGKLTYTEMAKYDRLTKLIKQIDHLLRVNYNSLKKVIYEVLGESYQEGYYLTAWAVETDTLSKLAYTAIAAETIMAMIENPISGLSLSERLEKNRKEIIYTIQQEVTQGLVQGETYGTMMKRLKTSLEGDTTKAMRIVRTEAHRAVETSKLDSATHANKNGVVMMKEWNSVQDERVRHTKKANHRTLNGDKIPVTEDFVQGLVRGKGPSLMGSASHDINCRCFLTYSVERVQKPDAKELEGMLFDQWKKERLKG